MGKILNSANNLTGTRDTLGRDTSYVKDVLYRLDPLINALRS
jgi:hypothetical protein